MSDDRINEILSKFNLDDQNNSKLKNMVYNELKKEKTDYIRTKWVKCRAGCV